MLMTYRLLQLRPAGHRPEEHAVLADVHSAWLPTYSSALRDFEPAPAPAPAADLDPDSSADRRRWLALVTEPFCRLLRHELAAAAGEANAAAGRELLAPAVAEAFETHMINRFELAVAWAVEADQNVAFARLGSSRDRATAQDHDDYFERTFRDAASCHDFYLRFPVLARWLATVTRLLCDNATQLIGRLARDADEIGAELFGEPVVAFTSLDLGKSDYHAGATSVAIVGVRLGSGPDALVYKPRSVDAESAMQGLLERLTDDGVIGFAAHRVLAEDGYGYEQLIPSDRNHVGSAAEAARTYEELGGFLAIFHVLGGSDLHYENVIVADGHAFICDCETVLGVALRGHEPAAGTVLDSVYRTGLLEWPLPPTADIVLRLSGYAGGEAYEVPFALPRLQEGPMLAVRYETGVRVDQEAPNRVHLDGELVEPRDYEDAIVRGFCRVHDWFRETPSAGHFISRLFAGTEVRFIARSTQIYAQLLIAVRHPRCLIEPLEVDLVFGRLDEAPHQWDTNGLAGAHEAASLWQLDVPTFSTRATATELLHDHRTPTHVTIERSPLRLALERIDKLSTDDRLRQIGYISASLSLAEVHSATFVTTALEYAHLVADELCTQLEDPARLARWTFAATGAEPEGNVEGTLYYGSAGVALFLAYLDACEPDEKLRCGAERALAHSLAHVPDGIGAFDGLAGQIYVLAHLHRLWDDPRLLALALGKSRQVDAVIDEQRDFDVLSGSAGVIAVMLGLTGVDGEAVAIAHRCARHLLAHAEATQPGLSWPLKHREDATANLTGFAHGSAGIGWALIALGAATGRADYVEAGRQAFAYERLHFDDERRDWYDLRTSVLAMSNGRRHFGNAWCNGAAGIGLSRLASWAALGRTDDGLLGETYLALSATLRNFESIGNDTLCHGRSGNCELMLRFARVRDEPAFQLEANTHAQAHWRRLASTPDWPRIDSGHQPLSGLMVGIAGVGMHFLRLAHPDRIPSPLLLDPPPPRP